MEISSCEGITADCRAEVYAKYLGLELTSDGKVVRSEDFNARARSWLGGMSHHYLRCTRVLKCLRLCAESDLASAFFAALEQIDADGLVRNARTLQFWEEAVRERCSPARRSRNAQISTRASAFVHDLSG